ncbi:MAG: hypothetical protein OEL66_07100, partial [Desulfobulbaceae bacterium]|nr:hypothetical protein [Desulfobulbaceae bacterium]
MSLSSDTILSVNLINHKGRQFFQDRWDVFVETLREGLQQAGRLDTQQSKENLFIFSFNHPFTALASCLESIDRAKAALAWKEEYGASAIQIVMHLDNATDRYNDIYDVTAAMWNFLQHESIYVSRSMKSKWPQLMEGRKLPSLSIDNESGGVFLLKFHEPAKIEIDRLFPHRQLALNGPEKECFYCGRTDHIPAKCPCKYLTMGIKALPFVGFMTFSELSRIYSDVFSHPDVVLAKLSAGIEPGSIKTDSAMLVYLAYFDLFRVYQPRFLYHISFTNYTRWEEIGRMDRSRIDNNNLNMGFDCLRVGQYGHAQKWLSS